MTPFNFQSPDFIEVSKVIKVIFLGDLSSLTDTIANRIGFMRDEIIHGTYLIRLIVFIDCEYFGECESKGELFSRLFRINVEACA